MGRTGAKAGLEGGVSGPGRLEINQTSRRPERNSRRIKCEFAILHNGDHDGAVGQPAVVQNVAPSQIDNQCETVQMTGATPERIAVVLNHSAL
jgi:hypothetical protein